MTLTRSILGCGLLWVAACGGGEAEPPSPDARGLVLPTATRPGPCASTRNSVLPRRCTMTYDAEDRLTGIECDFEAEVGGGGSCPMNEEWILAYDDAGALTGIHRQTQECDSALFVYDAVRFGDRSGVQRRSRAFYRSETTVAYEPELVLTRHPFETELPLPDGARDALVSSHHELENGQPQPTITDHTFTYDGPPRQGVRTQTRDDGVEVTFEYDAEGRLIAVSGDAPARTYEHDGERLVRDGAVSYEHDEHGNLIRRIDADTGVATVYDYGCWE